MQLKIYTSFYINFLPVADYKNPFERYFVYLKGNDKQLEGTNFFKYTPFYFILQAVIMYGNKYPAFFSFADPVSNDSGFDFFTGGDDNIQLHYNSYFPSDSGFGLDPKELHGVDPLKYEQVDFMDMEEEMMMMRPPSSRFDDDDMFEDDNCNSDAEDDERDVSNDDMEMNEDDDEEEELSDQSSKCLQSFKQAKRVPRHVSRYKLILFWFGRRAKISHTNEISKLFTSLIGNLSNPIYHRRSFIKHCK